MKTVLISLLLITLVGSLAGGGLFAYFSDTETSAGNTYSIGKLDLELATVNTPIEAKPCQWFRWETDILTLTTDSSLRGHLSLKLDAPLPPVGADPYVNEYWQGGLNPEPEQLAEGDNHNDNNLKDCMEAIIVMDPIDKNGEYVDILETITNVNPSPKNVGEAKVVIDAANQLLYTPWMGKLKDLTTSWKALGSMYPGQGPRTIEIIVHLCDTGAPQNEMQGDIVKIDKSYYVQQFGCDEGPGGGKGQVLPAVKDNPANQTIKANIVYTGATSYWKTKFSNLPAPPPGDTWDINDTTWYPTWCIDRSHTMPANATYTVQLMSSLNPAIYTTSANWGYNPPIPNAFNYVNYLINPPGPNIYHADYHTGGGESDLQWAIWYFIDGINYAQVEAHSATAKAMVDNALANGGNFQPEEGQLAVVVIFKMFDSLPKGSFQIVCFETDP